MVQTIKKNVNEVTGSTHSRSELSCNSSPLVRVQSSSAMYGSKDSHSCPTVKRYADTSVVVSERIQREKCRI